MSIQSNKVDLRVQYEKATTIRDIRNNQEQVMGLLRDALAQEVIQKVNKGRTDFVRRSELYRALSSVLGSAGFPVKIKHLEKYL